MSNLSELLPAGGGGKTADFVASGTLPNGVAVAVNSNGTISQVDPDGYPPTAGTASVFESANTSSISSCYVPNNKVLLVYQDNANSGYNTAILGTISGKTITFDSPYILKSTAGTGMTAAVYYAADDKVIVFYQYGDGYQKYLTARQSVSGALSFGSEFYVATNGYNQNFTYIYASYDPSASRAVITYRWAYPYFIQYVEAIQLNGNNISTGSNYELGSPSAEALTYDPVNSRTIIAYNKTGTNIGIRMKAMNISSNNSISFGSEYNPSISGYFAKLIYDTSQSRIVMAYSESASPYLDSLIAFSFDGSTFIKGTAVSTGIASVQISYDSNSNKIGIFGNDTNGQSYPYQSKFKIATLSGSTITINSTVDISIASLSGTDIRTIIYDSASQVFVLNYKDQSTNFGNSIAVDSGASNNIDFIGVTAAAISNSATGTVTLRGGVAENFSGLTPNTTYYVQTDGSINTSTSDQKAGKALSSSKLLIVG